MAVEKGNRESLSYCIQRLYALGSWKGGCLELDRQLFEVPCRGPPPLFFASCVITHPYDFFLHGILVWWDSVGF